MRPEVHCFTDVPKGSPEIRLEARRSPTAPPSTAGGCFWASAVSRITSAYRALSRDGACARKTDGWSNLAQGGKGLFQSNPFSLFQPLSMSSDVEDAKHKACNTKDVISTAWLSTIYIHPAHTKTYSRRSSDLAQCDNLCASFWMAELVSSTTRDTAWRESSVFNMNKRCRFSTWGI